MTLVFPIVYFLIDRHYIYFFGIMNYTAVKIKS